MRIQSNDVVILDTTDTKKIDLHITSNHPTVQIYDQNASQGTLTPDWSITALELTPIIYVDSEIVTDSATRFVWTRIKGSETAEYQVSTSKILRIANNDLDESPTIRYKCTVEYNGKSFFNEITFARVSTGKDGQNGSSAPAVKAQYSVDGSTSWVSTLNTSTHKYIRFSYDNGATWTLAIKIAGEDGKSVQIKGVAYAKVTPIAGQTITLYSDVNTNTQIANATNGDSYLVDGYLCVYNGTNFVCAGQIQGPQGLKGDSYYLFIRYADNTNGSGISTSSDGKSYIGFYRSSVNQMPTDVSSATWNWAKFVGEDAKSIALNANAQVFKIDKSNTMTPTTITVTAQAINTTIPSSGWTYSIDGGKTFSSTAPTGVTRSGNVVTLTGASITSNSIVIKASDGIYSDILTIYKVFDGSDGKPGDDGKPAPIVFLTNENISFAANANGQITGTTVYCNVVAYSGTTKVTPTVGTILSTEIPTGMTIGATTTTSNEIVIPITIANNATLGSVQNVNGTINIPITSPVATSLKLSWSKINSGVKGDTGTGISSVTVTYGTSTSASIQPTSWQSTIPTVDEGSYLWTRTVTDYTDSSIADTVAYTYAKQGAKGDTGSTGSPVTVSKIEYQAGTSATTAPTGTWSGSVVSVAEGNYLWTKTTFSDNKVAYGVAKQGTKGDKGDAGTNASLVDITPSALYFKSTTGKNGTFTPDYIYLYPRFQTVTFSKWEYSVNGGTTWVAASGANGLTISTYNSIANTLRIAKTSTLYTDTVTSISFRCVSSNTSVYDTVSIGKLFDVDVEEINTRITNSLAEVKTTTDSISSRVSATETSIGTINNNISSITNRVSAAEQKITPTAIVSTVRQSTDYTNDLGKKVNSSEIISKINQTAESVTISANKIGLLGATNIPDLTADKIKGGTLTLGGSSAQTQNGQILVKNALDAEMIAINQYGMAISDGNLMIVDESEINEYGGWSSYSHTKLKTTGMTSMYIARNSSAEYHAEVDAIDGLTMKCLGGLNANPYYFHIGPTDGFDDDGSQITFYQKLRLADGTVSSGTTDGDVVADLSLNEVVLPKANIILQDTSQKNIQFQNASKELRSCMLYAGANDSTTVMGAWDTTKSKSIFTYSTDNKFYILDSEAVTKTMMQSSVGERGYQKLPSGLIIQWGYQGSALTVSGNYNITTGNITLPIAFPNSFTGIFCNIIEVDDGSLSGYYNITSKANGLTGFTWKAYNYFNNWGSSILFSWLAIGY